MKLVVNVFQYFLKLYSDCCSLYTTEIKKISKPVVSNYNNGYTIRGTVKKKILEHLERYEIRNVDQIERSWHENKASSKTSLS